MKAIPIGDIAIAQVVEDQRALFDPSGFLPDVGPATIEAERGWMTPRYFDAETGSLVLCVQSYVFRAGGRNVLVDTCVGNGKQGRGRESWNDGDWPWLENLAAAGYAPDDIDVVLCTHLHVDHAGWNTRLEDGRWVPTFANAEYLTAREELAALKHKVQHGAPQHRHLYEDSVLPVIESGQTVLVESDHSVCAGVALEPSPGHTAGHVSVRIASGGDEAVCIGDMIHHPIQARYPDWNSRVCEDGEQARATRRAFLEGASADGTMVLPAHFDPCRVVREGEAFRFLLPA